MRGYSCGWRPIQFSAQIDLQIGCGELTVVSNYSVRRLETQLFVNNRQQNEFQRLRRCSGNLANTRISRARCCCCATVQIGVSWSTLPVRSRRSYIKERSRLLARYCTRRWTILLDRKCPRGVGNVFNFHSSRVVSGSEILPVMHLQHIWHRLAKRRTYARPLIRHLIPSILAAGCTEPKWRHI